MTSRRSFLAVAGSALVLGACGASGDRQRPGSLRKPAATNTPPAAASPRTASAAAPLRALERRVDRRIGVYARDTGSGRTLAYRADERFPMCSVFKLLVVADVLHRADAAELARTVRYTAADVIDHSPVTVRHAGAGLSLEQLCAAALRYSDNTAADLVLRHAGGPQAVTAFARSLGDPVTRLDRGEPQLNSAVPGDPRDTTTPRRMADNLVRLATGDTLPTGRRTQLVTWLRRNTTGTGQIRAAAPRSWSVADRTGSGYYGTVNDVALLWPPHGAAPIVIAIFTHGRRRHDDWLTAPVADAARIALTAPR